MSIVQPPELPDHVTCPACGKTAFSPVLVTTVVELPPVAPDHISNAIRQSIPGPSVWRYAPCGCEVDPQPDTPDSPGGS